MIRIAEPIIGPEESESVLEVLKSGMLAQGPKVAVLEEAFAAYCGTKYAVAVNSGTAALHTALHAAGIGPGDEVITTPFSFIATINPILFVGAKPILVDIDPLTFNIDVSRIAEKISSKTKAILPVDLYGQPHDHQELRTVAKKHNLKVIEDACQAIGALYQEQKTGSLGDVGCFSLYATKNIMCGEGGMITSDDKTLIEAAKKFRQHGMVGPYEYAGIGYNYRMTDLQAAIAVEQLKKVDDFNKARQANAAKLTEGLKGIKGLTLPEIKPGRTHVYHQFTIKVESGFPLSRDEFLEALHQHGIGAGVYYPKPLHLYPHIARFGYKEGDFPEAERVAKRVISLPVHPKVSDSDIKNMIKRIKGIAHA